MGVGLLRRRRVLRTRTTSEVVAQAPRAETPSQRVADEAVVESTSHALVDPPKPQHRDERRGRR